MKFWKNALLGFAAAAFFSLLYLLGVLGPIEDRVYDFFLRFRARRERIDNVVFLDVDDPAIAYNGVFPWPRSITADGLLRLKEYGAKAAIFDIEYIDKGPPGVDVVYLDNGLPSDFNRSFSEINSAASEILNALKAGRVNQADIDDYAGMLTGLIADEQENLFFQAQSIARDNDLYLAEASALFGKSWATLNLGHYPLSGEQAERRLMAEDNYSQAITALPTANKGKYVDILPALPVFAQSARGAGFTNVEIDKDGIRRRIDLVQNIHDNWYYQLAFAPLMEYLGNPQVELDNNKMIIRGAMMPAKNGIVEKDLVIPLDGEGRMMLDWPPENYADSYRHVSFEKFSQLEFYEAELEKYSRALLSTTDINFFGDRDPSMAEIPFILLKLDNLFEDIRTYRAAALENCSDEYFNEVVALRTETRDLIRNILDHEPGAKVSAIADEFIKADSSSAESIKDEADYITLLCGALENSLDNYNEIKSFIEESVRDNFCILGRVDTGTTDIGVNPFHGEYVNVGTHAVVLDTILSESFITPLGIFWQILVALVGVTLLFIVTGSLSPLPRTIFGFSSVIAVLLASILLFRFTGIFFGPLGLVLAITVAAVIREIIFYAASEKDKQFYRKAFATYTSEAVANEIAKNPDLLQLGGTKRQMSAIFTDIRGFTSVSEQLAPEDLVSLLNRYLTIMSNVILDAEGTIDKYEGDAIIAFFGAPVEQPEHALRSCISAIRMKKAEAELNRIILEQSLSPSPLLTRIGINSGDMVVGNMGTDKKMNYTIMGDAVNLTARLEGVNKQYRTWILATDNTIQQTEGNLLVRRLDQVRVVGKSEPVQLYNILNTIEDASDEQKKLVNVFHESLDCFKQRDWIKAKEGFMEVLNMEGDGPAPLYIKRCEQYLHDEPEKAWDGIFNLTDK